MAKKKVEEIAVTLKGFDVKHYKRTEAYTKAVDKLFATAVSELATISDRVAPKEGKPFSFDDYPGTKKAAGNVMSKLTKQLQVVIQKGTRDEWLAACTKNDAFLNSILQSSKLSKAQLNQYFDRNLDGLATFQARKVNGLNLSQRVWNYAGQFKDAMELGIDVGLGSGRTAQELSRDLRGYLKREEGVKDLYRRVKDKHGNLHLSKAAALYHPGQGKYRSAYKNAMRLARTEINLAYRDSDHQRWQNLDFVVGMRVNLSNNHTTIDRKTGKPVPFKDICDELQGDYPKTFKFTGWHPQCRCFVTPIMKDYDEYNDDRAARLKAVLRGEEYKSLPSRKTVTEVPQSFNDYIDSIKDRATGWKSQPYYIRDNFVDGKIDGGLNSTIQNQTTSNAKADKFVMDYFSKSESFIKKQNYSKYAQQCGLSSAESTVIREYTNAFYKEINKALRTEDTQFEHRQMCVNVLNRGLNKLTVYKGICFRGSSLIDKQIQAYKDALNSNIPIIERGYISTTIDFDRVINFTNNVIFEITSKRGRVLKTLSLYKDENEVLFTEGSRFEVTKISTYKFDENFEVIKIYLDEL